jgi:hypothetical protein
VAAKPVSVHHIDYDLAQPLGVGIQWSREILRPRRHRFDARLRKTPCDLRLLA